MARQPRRTVGVDLRVDPDALADYLASLPTLPRDTLVERWTAVFGRPPPKGMSRRLIERAVAYQLQAQALGGLKAGVLRKLKRHAAVRDTNSIDRNIASAQLAPGTQLIREWNGRNHTVEVTAAGLLWSGSTYRSLSAVAQAITGTKWSGPRFFGL